MKILHIAPDRDAALVAARNVHGIAQNVTLDWVQTPAAALQWLQGNRDAAAVIVEVQAQSCASFVEELRRLGLTTPVVVVAGSARLELSLGALNSGADGYLVAGPSLDADLPRTVVAAIERERSRASELAAAAARLADEQARHSVSLARETKICLALQQRLFELESAAVSFADQLAKRHAEFTASLAQAARSRDALDAELSAATAALDTARQARRADAAAAAEHLRRRETELRAHLAEAVAGRTALDKALAEATAAHQDTRQRAAIDLAAATERQAAIEDLLAQETDRRTSLDQQLSASEAAHIEADRRRAAEFATLNAKYDAALEENAADRHAFERQTAEAASALERAGRERTAEATAAAAQIASIEAELGAQLAHAAAVRTTLERTLTEAQSAHQHAMQRAAEDLASAAARQMVLEERLAQETDRGLRLERQLSAADTAQQESGQSHAAELTRAAAGLAELQARYDTAQAENAADRHAFERQTAEAASALERAGRERTAEAAAATAQIASIEAELGAQLAEAAAARTALERTLTEAQSAHQHAVEELASAAAQLASLQTRYDTAVTEHAAAQVASEQRLTDAATAYQQAEARTAAALAAASAREAELVGRLTRESDARQDADRRHASELADAAAQLASLQTRYDTSATEHAAAQVAAEQRLTDAATAYQQAEDRTAAAVAAALAREAELVARLARESDARQDADRRHALELANAAAQLASLQTRYDTAVTEHAAAQVASEQRLTDAATAYQQAEDRTAAALAAASAREAELVELLARESDARQDADLRYASELATAQTHLASLQTRYDTSATEHAAAHAASERRLTAAATASQQAEDRTAAAVAAALAREAELVGQLTRESAARVALERDLTGTRMESARGRDRSLYVISAYRRREREHKARFEEQLTGERIVADRELRSQDEEIRQLQLEEETLRHLLGTTQDELRHLHGTVEEERQAHERALSTSESELHRVSADYGQVRQSFDRLQSAFQTLEQIAGDHAAERVRLEAVVADRDRQLSAQAERHRGAEQDAQDALAELQETLQQARDAGDAEIVRLQGEIDAGRRELDATRTHAEALRGVAARVPDLQTQLERSQNERRRQFERAPYALCRCSEGGAITEANHSFVTLLGCRRVDELQSKDFVAAALDSAGDLGWLLERARTTRKTETVETHWKTREGRRLVVRLQALATTAGSIDIVAEDITGVRALEERLRQAQRMEAVGRLASEVAITCDALLGDVAVGAHEWLARVEGDDALRRHAERVLTDVTRAASFLRQLGMYGNEQERALEPVSAQRVLRDLAPVLQRLVGDQIALVLPKSAGSFEVDVDTERLERVLINVAGYARERMPSGGQVRIDLATTAVGRRFVARYSNVRPGNHVLITVTELPAAGGLRGESATSSVAANKPGVDLGVLVDLIASCGGHLWLEAQPAGNMVVKIHLPKPAAANATDDSGARASKWFRSRSAANVRA